MKRELIEPTKALALLATSWGTQQVFDHDGHCRRRLNRAADLDDVSGRTTLPDGAALRAGNCFVLQLEGWSQSQSH